MWYLEQFEEKSYNKTNQDTQTHYANSVTLAAGLKLKLTQTE